MACRVAFSGDGYRFIYSEVLGSRGFSVIRRTVLVSAVGLFIRDLVMLRFFRLK